MNINTIVRAVTVGGSPALVSASIRERAFVRVSLHLRRHGRAARFFGSIRPAGAPVQIELQRRLHGRWVTIARTGTHRVSASLAAYARTLCAAPSRALSRPRARAQRLAALEPQPDRHRPLTAAAPAAPHPVTLPVGRRAVRGR